MKLNEFEAGTATVAYVGKFVALHGGSPMGIGNTSDEALAEALSVMPDDADLSTLTVEQIEADEADEDDEADEGRN